MSTMKRIEFTEQQLLKIFYLYDEAHLSMKKIGEEFGVSRSVISRVLKENNIEIRKDNHVYKANYRIFENIDSPEKAYWLGFIAADGNVYVRDTNATISIT